MLMSASLSRSNSGYFTNTGNFFYETGKLRQAHFFYLIAGFLGDNVKMILINLNNNC